MAAIIPFLRDNAFDQNDIQSMSLALEHVCLALGITDAQAREVVARRIIENARRGDLDWVTLRDRVLRETNGASLAMSDHP